MTKRKTIMLLVTHRCNLRCSYCYEPKNTAHDMTVPQAKRYIEDVVQSLDESYDDFEVQFMGGEPLLRFPFIKGVSEWLWNESFPKPLAQVFAPTNGTLLNDEMKAWFSENKERICLGLSFDGNRIMQDINRSNSYANVDLDFFLTTWPNQTVKMTLSPETLMMLYEGVTELQLMGFKYLTADLAMGMDIGWDTRHLSVLNEQLSRLSDFYLAHPEIPCMSMLNLDLSLVGQSNSETKRCGCGETLVCIDYDGKQYACHLFSPVTASKEQALASQRLDFRDYTAFQSKMCKDCLLNPICNICYGMNFLCNRDVTKQSPFFCHAFKIQFLANCAFQYRRAETCGDNGEMEYINQLIESINE